MTSSRPKAASGTGTTASATTVLPPPADQSGAFRLGAPSTHVPLRELARLITAWGRAQFAALRPEARAERRYCLAREALVSAATERALREREDEWIRSVPMYGAGLDERVVEYPWTYARLRPGARLLDVGSTLNHPQHLACLRAHYAEIVFLNPFSDDGYRCPLDGVSYVRSDVRSHWLRPASFSQVTCLSTLEHVGCDNSRYGGPRHSAAPPADTRRARADAMRQLRVLVAEGGSLLLTVPYGRSEEHDWFVQLDASELAHAVEAFRPSSVDATYFLYDDRWRVATAAECADARYGTRTRAASAVACLELRP